MSALLADIQLHTLSSIYMTFLARGEHNDFARRWVERVFRIPLELIYDLIRQRKRTARLADKLAPIPRFNEHPHPRR